MRPPGRDGPGRVVVGDFERVHAASLVPQNRNHLKPKFCPVKDFLILLGGSKRATLRAAMYEESWKPKPVPRDWVLVEELSEVAGVDRKSLLEWSRAGLLPKPQSSRGRGIVSKWPRIALELAKVVRKYREQGFGLLEIRPYLVKAFGEKILEVLPEPTIPTRKRGRKAAAPEGPA